MTTSSRRHRSDSIAGQMAAFQQAAAAKTIGWPETVSPMRDATDQAKAEAILREILTARTSEDWLAHPYDLAQAARLAATLVQIDLTRDVLSHEGPTAFGGKNGTTVIVSPFLAVLSSLQAIANQISRALHVGMSTKATEQAALRADASARAGATGRGGDNEDAALLGGFDA